MENPYQSPAESGSPIATAGTVTGRAKQIRVVAILMIVHGALLLFAAAGLAVIAVIFPERLNPVEALPDDQPGDAQSRAHMRFYMTLGYSVMAGASALAGIANIAAGVFNYQYRARMFGIVALFSSLLAMLNCYCIPTSLGLLIYGMIVYLSHDSIAAFESHRQSPAP